LNSEEFNKNSVTVHDVSKSFLSITNRARIQVLSNINLIANPGEITALMGSNGSGKTTLLRLISGLIKPSSGNIYLFGNSSLSRKSKTIIGFLPENPQFHKGISGLRFLTYIGRLKGLKNPNLMAKAWLNRFGIDEKWQNLPTNIYSEGMKERVGLASAFLNPKSQILLLDEPLENLDTEMKKITIKLIQEAAKDQGKVIITAMHPDPDFEPFIDKKILIKGGYIS
jgi:ABC-2 type transport system ATP-binding protein